MIPGTASSLTSSGLSNRILGPVAVYTVSGSDNEADQDTRGTNQKTRPPRLTTDWPGLRFRTLWPWQMILKELQGSRVWFSSTSQVHEAHIYRSKNQSGPKEFKDKQSGWFSSDSFRFRTMVKTNSTTNHSGFWIILQTEPFGNLIINK